jgi:carboxyl-terminal processing protease
VIRFNVWRVTLSQGIDRAIDELRDCRGIVIDLRGNPGGLAGMVMGIAGHFFDEQVALGTMRSRSGKLDFVANPRRSTAAGVAVRPFAGRVAIVVDGLSASTSEFFAGGMQSLGRARVFGETTAGQALPATLVTLPDGDVLLHAFADFWVAGGRRLEGVGVTPDEPVALRRADLLAGRDSAMDAAIRWAASGERRP